MSVDASLMSNGADRESATANAIPKYGIIDAEWTGNRGKPLNMQRWNSGGITERLACRVKGLTPLFCILLLTILTLRDSCHRDDGQKKAATANAWHLQTTALRCHNRLKPGW
ncbi:hypothetical protein ACQR1W_02010 [Bradyrhizobium sp. HKCCYLS1011]|uniref:hypothetical protein n=1 Tax=Bradyrhizobium sp. HKCCYLS1011 TaxID=3420733 RepID=UPI003EB883C3